MDINNNDIFQDTIVLEQAINIFLGCRQYGYTCCVDVRRTDKGMLILPTKIYHIPKKGIICIILFHNLSHCFVKYGDILPMVV